MAELSAATGVAGSTIYYHYKTKEDLFLSILASVRETVNSDFERYFNQQKFDSGLEMVEGAVRLYLHLAGSREEIFLSLHRHYPYKLAEINQVCRDHLEAIHNCFVDIFFPE